MTSKRCFFVVGSEGSGTYMLAEALIAAGCEYIDTETDLRRALMMPGRSDNVVIRRSIPHRGEFIDLYTVASIANLAGYRIQAIAIFREPNATCHSVYRRAKTKRNDVYENMMGAMTCISELSMGFSVLPITYEAVVGSWNFRYWLFEKYCGLKYPEGYKFYDGNSKHYGMGGQ